MTRQFSTAVRNALAGTFEGVVGAGPTLEIRTGPPPASCAAADSGTLLASIALPSDWLGAASAGAVASTATWSTSSAAATGTAGHYRLKDGASSVHEQGTVTATGAGGDMQLASTSIDAGQAVAITAYSFGVGGA